MRSMFVLLSGNMCKEFSHAHVYDKLCSTRLGISEVQKGDDQDGRINLTPLTDREVQ
jgi:hypothetical protein